jgi:hypothetical protein
MYKVSDSPMKRGYLLCPYLLGTTAMTRIHRMAQRCNFDAKVILDASL